MRFGIHDADDSAVGRDFAAFKREAGFFASAPENQFTRARADRIHRHQCFTRRLQFGIQRLNNHQLPRGERGIFDGGNDSADDASQLHKLDCGLQNAA